MIFLQRIVYLNFDHDNPLEGRIIKTNLPLSKLTTYLASLIMKSKYHKPKDLIDNLPNTKLVNNDNSNHGLYRFAEYVFNNNAVSENVPVSSENTRFKTGVRISNAFYDHEHVYVIYLDRIVKTHSGTNTQKYEKIAKKLINDGQKSLLIKKGLLGFETTKRRKKRHKRLFA